MEEEKAIADAQAAMDAHEAAFEDGAEEVAVDNAEVTEL